MTTSGTYVKVERTGGFTPGQLSGELIGRLRETVKNHAELIQEHIRANLRGSKHGDIGTSAIGLKYVMSAPGEAPATDTGRLLQSIRTEFSGDGMMAEIGSFGVDYAQALEEGIGMEARPFVAPAVEAYGDDFIRAIQRDIAMSLS